MDIIASKKKKWLSRLVPLALTITIVLGVTVLPYTLGASFDVVEELNNGIGNPFFKNWAEGVIFMFFGFVGFLACMISYFILSAIYTALKKKTDKWVFKKELKAEELRGKIDKASTIKIG